LAKKRTEKDKDLTPDKRVRTIKSTYQGYTYHEISRVDIELLSYL
jgi:hypothetical protein